MDANLERIIRSLETVLANGHKLIPVPERDLRVLIEAAWPTPPAVKCRYPTCDCAVDFPGGHKPSPTECPAQLFVAGMQRENVR